MAELAAEFIGTSVAVFAGCGAIMTDAVAGGTVTHVGVALAFGLAVALTIAFAGWRGARGGVSLPRDPVHARAGGCC